MTQDSVLVLIHDEALGRITASGPVQSFCSLSDVRALRLVTNAGDTTRYQVPTAAEAHLEQIDPPRLIVCGCWNDPQKRSSASSRTTTSR